MARYNPRSRRRRRPRSRRRGENRLRLYMVLTVVLCGAIYFAIKWRDGQGADPNDVNSIVREIIPAADFGQQSTPDDMRAEVNAPDLGQTLPTRPEASVEPEPTLSPDIVEAIPEVDTQIAEATALLRQDPEGKLIEARDQLNFLLEAPMGIDQGRLVKGKLADLAQKWLFGAKVYPGDSLCETYKVQSGDLLQNIGRRYKVPYQLLMKINNIRRAQDLQAGAVIKVVNGPFHTRVKRSSFTMDLYLQDTYVKNYEVGLGLEGRETPTGDWIVRDDDKGKMEEPEWTDPDTGRRYFPGDPEYPLGSRWIGLKGIAGAAVGRTGFAIHGTKEPETIGTNSSRGCIRLLNGQVKEVYDMMYPGRSKVTVED